MSLGFITGGTIVTLLILVVAIIIIAFILSFVPIGLWISAIAAGVKVGIFTLVGMRLRRVKPKRVIEPMIKAHKAGIQIGRAHV